MGASRPEKRNRENDATEVAANRDDRSNPPCAICGPAKPAKTTIFRMTHAVVIWLCETHRHPEYLQGDRGRTFTRQLAATWAANGMVTRSRARALRGHHRRVDGVPCVRPRPGSYSWPRLRLDAEARFARGENVRAVITTLRGRHREDYATIPSIRTMRRWFAEGRWLQTDVTREPVTGRTRRRPARPTPKREPLWWLPPVLVAHDPLWPFSLFFYDDG